MSEVKVNKISPRTNCGTVTLGDSGDTFTIPSGVTITNNGTQTGFGRTGAVDWQTTKKTATFTAVSGEGYFVDTSAGVVTVNLPSSPSAGNIVAVVDYAGTADTNNITIGRGGSNINGDASDLTIEKPDSGIVLVYVDATQGWKNTETSNLDDITLTPAFVAATGGTESTCGDFKIHTFTGPGTFTVSCAGNVKGSNTLEYIVVAGGGSGGNNGGGGGAGGFRFASPTLAPATYPGKPLAAPAGITAASQSYPITVGAGGTGSPYPSGTNSNGNTSSFSTITSAGGGRGGTNPGGTPPADIGTGGSGGGGAYVGGPSATGAAGNTPPSSPPQGNPGGTTGPGPYPHGGPASGSGGGGAMAAGTSATSSLATGGPGGVGAGIPSAFGANGQPSGGQRYYSGGGGGAAQNSSPGDKGVGGLGGGASSGLQEGTASSATANTGGGGGGSAGGSGISGAGGSGIVIIRYKFQ